MPGASAAAGQEERDFHRRGRSGNAVKSSCRRRRGVSRRRTADRSSRQSGYNQRVNILGAEEKRAPPAVTTTLSGNLGVPPVAGRSLIGGLALSSSNARTLQDFDGWAGSVSAGSGNVAAGVAFSNTSTTATLIVGRGIGTRAIAAEGGRTQIRSSLDCLQVGISLLFSRLF